MGIGLRGIGMVRPIVKGVAYGGLTPWDFDPLLVTFTPGMAKRATSVFAASPIVQGKRDGTGVPDIVTFPNGTSIAGSYFYSNFDSNQGSISFRITPEWNGTDGVIVALLTVGVFTIDKWSGSRLYIESPSGTPSTSIVGWIAGATYNVCIRWDFKNTLDGTNYVCFSINDIHTFVQTTPFTLIAPPVSISLGSSSSLYPANAIIEGLTIYRRVLYDGTYGVNVGNGDEVNLISAGVDPCTVTGSWDVCFCLPTNATPGALVTGNGEAWSHPHSSNLLTRGFLNDRYYGGGQWGVKFNGTSSKIDCGSGATLDDIPNGAVLQVEGWFRWDGSAISVLVSKGGVSTATGWNLYLDATGLPIMLVDLATTNATATHTTNAKDGKWHHIVGSYVDATWTARVAIDGVWGAAGAAGSGAYVSDAALSLNIGMATSGTAYYFSGSMGWINIHNDAHYTPGTNFLPPRAAPAPDVEEWLLNEGTGVTATAQVTTPANDGTITDGTWEPQWYDEGSPVRLQSVVGGANYAVNAGSGATIDDLADNALTVDGWINVVPRGYQFWANKRGAARACGWCIDITPAGYAEALVKCATIDASSLSNEKINDTLWHYFKATFDDAGDRKLHLYIDNIEVTYATQTAGVGAIISDAAEDLYLFTEDGASYHFEGRHGWTRISNVVRGAGMIPRSNPPAPDANTMAQWNTTDGAGAVLTDTSGNANHGAMAGTYSWNNSPAMESDSPGARNYAWGYVFGNDAADEGFKQTWSGLTVGKDYVIRGLAYSEDGVGQPEMIVYDETNAAILKTMTGTVTSTEKVPDLLMCSFELPTVARGAAADCVSISVKIINTVATGVVGFQQVELLANLLDNPSLDTGAVADPWIPYGWATGDLDAGDTEIETVIIHSTGSSIQFNASAGLGIESISTTLVSPAGKFISIGGAIYDAATYALSGLSQIIKQASLATAFQLTSPAGAIWNHKHSIGRGIQNPKLWAWGNGSVYYLDDLYAILLDDVSLTVTPASAANSVESGGIRVDGWDLSPQAIPTGRLFATQGWTRIRYLPRHSGADALKFGSATPYLVDYYGDANNYFYVYWSAASTMTLAFKSAGGALQTGNWATAGAILAGGNYLLEVKYDAGNMYLYVDGVLRITVTSPIAFTTIPVFCYPATANTVVAGQHDDSVFTAP